MSFVESIGEEVARVLAPYSRNVASYLKKTQELVDKVRSRKMPEDEVLVRFDVNSLFTS